MSNLLSRRSRLVLELRFVRLQRKTETGGRGSLHSFFSIAKKLKANYLTLLQDSWSGRGHSLPLTCHNVHVLDGNSVVSNKHAYAENVYMSANLLGMPIMAVSARVAPIALLGGLLAFTVLRRRTFEA